MKKAHYEYLPIYGRHCFYGNDIDSILKTIKLYFNDSDIDLTLITEMDEAEGYVAPIMCKTNDDRLKALVMFVRDKASVGTVAHEAVHMVNHVFDYLGQDLCTVNDEAQAYLTGHFVQEFMSKIRGDKNSKSGELTKLKGKK